MKRRGDRGAQTLDFAIWFPIVVIVLLSTVQLSFDLYAQRQADQFADAAVVRVADGDSVADVAAAIRSDLGDDATVSVRDGQVRVRVASPQIAPWIPGNGRVGEAGLAAGPFGEALAASAFGEADLAAGPFGEALAASPR